MSNTLGIVEVAAGRTSPDSAGARLSPAARRFGDISLLEWIVRRVTESMLLDQVVVVVDEAHSETARHLSPPDVAVFASPQSDAVARCTAALRRYGADQMVRVSLASPFVDPELIDRLICTAHAHPGADYIGYVAHRGGPAVLSQLGMFADWCRAEAMFRAERLAAHPAERADTMQFVYSHPELFKLRLIPVPPQLDRDDFRLTVSFEEDWDHAQTIVDALGPEALDWQRIAELLDQHPALRERMAVLNQAEQSTASA